MIEPGGSRPPYQRNGQTTDSVVLAEMAIHDLRTPAHAILGNVSVLLSGKAGPLSDLQREFLESAFIAARRLDRLVNDIQVTFGRLQGFSLDFSDIDLLELATNCIRELTPFAQEANLAIELIEPSTRQQVQPSYRVRADPMRIEQIVLNMLQNAAQYADPGTAIQMRIRVTARRILLAVENAVEYLPEENPGQWIVPFQRGSQSSSRAANGRGLGLTVVNHLVTLHDGRVFLRRRNNTVTVAFCLPR